MMLLVTSASPFCFAVLPDRAWRGHGEVAQVGLEQFLPWKHAELHGEKNLNAFASIKPLQIMKCNLKGNYMLY